MLWSRRKYTPTRSCSYVAVLGGGLLLMKDSGGERMHYPYWECILSPTDFDVGSECWDSVCTHIGQMNQNTLSITQKRIPDGRSCSIL